MTKNDALRRPPVPSCPYQSRFMGLVCVRCRVEGIVLTPSKQERGSNTLGAANQGSYGIKGNSRRKTPPGLSGGPNPPGKSVPKAFRMQQIVHGGGAGHQKGPPPTSSEGGLKCGPPNRWTNTRTGKACLPSPLPPLHPESGARWTERQVTDACTGLLL